MTNNNIDTAPELISKNSYRIPLEFNGVQINFCKNPECENFGIPALVEGKFKRGLKDRYERSRKLEDLEIKK